MLEHGLTTTKENHERRSQFPRLYKVEIHANRQANQDLELLKKTQDTGDAETGLFTGQDGKEAMRSSAQAACKQRIPKNMAVDGYVCERALVRVCNR